MIAVMLSKRGEAKAMVKNSLYNYIATLLIIAVSSCADSVSKEVIERQNVLVDATSAEIDSVALDFNFYPERWALSGDSLWVVNQRDSLFLSCVTLNDNRRICLWGIIGNGPQDYVSPGILESRKGLCLYGNTENKVVDYELINGIPFEKRRGKLPVWMSEKGLPKPYTRIAAINDSICVGTYFMPRSAGADIFNICSGLLLHEVELALEQPEENMSGPYEFKVAVANGKMVVAYRYIDRIEVYDLADSYKPVPDYAIGERADQNDLYEADRDDEMIKYYSDIQCKGKYAYALYSAVETKDLSDSATSLLIYDINSGENVKNIRLDRFYDQLLVGDSGDIVLYSPVSEDNIYIVRDILPGNPK